jgi:hypothetical protein
MDLLHQRAAEERAVQGRHLGEDVGRLLRSFSKPDRSASLGPDERMDDLDGEDIREISW